jgi:pimeloyl-ACP methyl ester carboxylesterase
MTATAQFTPTRHFATTTSGALHYREAGAGPPLLLLHQFPRSSRMYLDLMPGLATRFRVIAMDTPGCGGSDEAPPGSGIPFFSEAAAALLDALEIDSAAVFAFHMGGGIGADLAARWPDRVTRLAVFGYPLVDDEQARTTFLTGLADKITPLTRCTPDGGQLARAWQRGYSDLVSWWSHAQQRPTLDDRAVEYIYRVVQDLLELGTSGVDLMTAMFAYDSVSTLRKVTVPFLHIEADSPFEHPSCKRGADLMQLVADGRAITMERSDGAAAEFRTADLAQLVLSFLEEG